MAPVNPPAVSPCSSLYWTDWNREAPKIESSSVEGQNRRVVVSDGIGLPNALTYDTASRQVCWADAGTLVFFSSSQCDQPLSKCFKLHDCGFFFFSCPRFIRYKAFRVCVSGWDWTEGSLPHPQLPIQHGLLQEPLLLHRLEEVATFVHPSEATPAFNHHIDLLHRDGVIAVNKESSQITDEYLPDQRSHLYGIAIATSNCLWGEKRER